MRKNNEQIDISNTLDDYIETPSEIYQHQLTSRLEEMAELVKAGHEIIWSDNKYYCTINGKTFNVHQKVWNARKDELL